MGRVGIVFESPWCFKIHYTNKIKCNAFDVKRVIIMKLVLFLDIIL